MRSFALVAVVVAVAVLAFGVDAQRGRGRPGRGPGGRGQPRPEPTSTWNRTVDTVDVEQRAFVNGTSVKVTTSGDNAATVGLGRRSGVLYDFAVSGTVVVAKSLRGCFVLDTPTGITLASLTTTIEGRNDTTVSDALTTVQLNATGEMLTSEEKEALNASNPSVGRLCRGARIFNTVAADAATFPASGAEAENERVVSFLTIDSKVDILLIIPPRPDRPSGGRPGGRPGGRGGGRRGGRPAGRRGGPVRS